ncbi:transposase, Ptta/En/Spm, transposase, Tnp1/En/Spm-like protein, partial [Tanacetum coccineum]
GCHNRRDEQDKEADFNRLIAVAEEKIHGKEIDLEILLVGSLNGMECYVYGFLVHYFVVNGIMSGYEVLSFECETPLCLSVVAVGCAIGIMETQAIDDQDPLVNNDNDNENDDLGYHSEEYFDEAQEDDENNHSNRNLVKRGITRLYKFHREYGKPDGIKLSVTFDALNRISGKHKALFSSFLGDMVREHIGLKILSWKKVYSEARDKLWDEITRYFDVDLTVRKLVMNRLGQLLRNFKRKLRQIYILPNKNTLSKLNEVPAKYSAILQVEEWVNFVKYTTTEEYKVKSTASKMARSKSVYQHTMGREIEPDEEPARGTLWLKGRVNKDGKYPDDEIRSVGDKLIETEDKINEGTLKVNHGTDEMTVILGKEKGGYARGVRSGVTYKSQLDNERRERQEKELLIQNLSNKMSQTEGMVSSVDINPINSNADEEGGTTVVGCENDASIQKSNKTPPCETVKSAIKCKLWHLKKSTIIALGTVYKTDGKQMLHNKELPKDCYKVSIDTSLVDAACIPDVGNNGFKTVKDAV